MAATITSNEARMTFGMVAVALHDLGWRPLPVVGKAAVMEGWNTLCIVPWDRDDLITATVEFNTCNCGIAADDRRVVLDVDVLDQDTSNSLARAADLHLGETPLVRVGRAPKFVRIYRRQPGSVIRSTKPKPVEVMCGSGQCVAFGLHEETGQPYRWITGYSPIDLHADDPAIPALDAAQLQRFLTAARGIVGQPHYGGAARRGRPRGLQDDDDVHQRLRVLAARTGFRRAAITLLENVVKGERYDTMRAVVWGAFGRGWSSEQVEDLFEHFAGWDDRDGGVTDYQFRHALEHPPGRSTA
jgi:hypothetical protein